MAPTSARRAGSRPSSPRAKATARPPAPSGSGTSPRCSSSSSTRRVLSLLSCTLGWSNGSMPRISAGDRHGELPQHELRAHVVDVAELEPLHREAGLLERRHLRRLPSVVLVEDVQRHELAVGAVHVGPAERLHVHREETLALLAGALGDELLEPRAEVADQRRRHEGDLVAAGQRALPEEGAQAQRRVLRRRHVGGAARPPWRGRDRAARRRRGRAGRPVRDRRTRAPSSARRCRTG